VIISLGRLFAGVAKTNITPHVGVPLSGYPDRKRVSEGVHDELYAKALVLYDGNEKIAIVTSDLVGYDEAPVAQIRSLIEEMTDIKGKNVMLSAAQNHSAALGTWLTGTGFTVEITKFPYVKPKIISQTERFPADIEAYQEMVIRKVAGAIYEANNRLIEAKIGVAKGNIPSGVICTNRHDPVNGVMDPEVSVIRVDDRNDNIMAVLMNYACHPTIPGEDNYFISADFPGAAMETVEAVCGKGAIALFANGTCGNISTRYARREQSFREVERLGRILAGEAIKTLYQIRTTCDVRLGVVSEVLELPRKELPSLEEGRENAKRKEAEFERLKREKASVADVRTAEVELIGARDELRRVEAHERGVLLSKTLPVEVQVLHINDIVLVGLPGEPFVEVGLYIKTESGIKNTIVVGHANGYSTGYVLTPEAYDSDIYERFQTQLTREGGTQIMETALNLIKDYHK